MNVNDTNPRTENLVLVIPDALRLDYHRDMDLPGATVKTICQAASTPMCIPTQVSGLSHTEHGAKWFFGENNEIDAPTVFDLTQEGYDTAFLDHPADRLREVLRHPAFKPLEDMEPPFVWVYRGLYTHTPYSYSWEDLEDWEDIGPRPDPREARVYPEWYADGPWETGNEYIELMRTGDVPWREDYEAAVETTHERIEGIVATLENMGVYDDTTVIVQGDHGEAFGGAADGPDDCSNFIHNTVCEHTIHVGTTVYGEDVDIDEPLLQRDTLTLWDERWDGGRDDLEMLDREPHEVYVGERGDEAARQRLRDLGYIDDD